MKETPSTGKSNSESMPVHAGGNGFLKLFTAGVVGWVMGVVLLFGLSWGIANPVSVPAAMIWTISHSWAGFLFGLLVLAGYGLKSGLSIGRAALAYLLPAAVLAGIGWVCLLVYPDYSLREDLLTYLPMVLLFYGMALLWMLARNGRADSDAFARAVIPSILGGVVILGFVTVPVFASDNFRYRNTFAFTVAKTEMRDGKLVAEGTLEIREPGKFAFSAPRYVWSMTSDEAEMESGVITWGAAGEPKADAPGVYPLQIAWSKVQADEGGYGVDMYEDTIQLEVRNPEEGDKLIYFLSAPMPASSP